MPGNASGKVQYIKITQICTIIWQKSLLLCKLSNELIKVAETRGSITSPLQKLVLKLLSPKILKLTNTSYRNKEDFWEVDADRIADVIQFSEMTD